MTPDPLEELERLEARRRHPVSRDPRTGRALPVRIPARQSVPSRVECWAVGVVAGCIGGVSLYAITHLVTGGVL